jgi:hypothetical protein
MLNVEPRDGAWAIVDPQSGGLVAVLPTQARAVSLACDLLIRDERYLGRDHVMVRSAG